MLFRLVTEGSHEYHWPYITPPYAIDFAEVSTPDTEPAQSYWAAPRILRRHAEAVTDTAGITSPKMPGVSLPSFSQPYDKAGHSTPPELYWGLSLSHNSHWPLNIDIFLRTTGRHYYHWLTFITSFSYYWPHYASHGHWQSRKPLNRSPISLPKWYYHNTTIPHNYHTIMVIW